MPKQISEAEAIARAKILVQEAIERLNNPDLEYSTIYDWEACKDMHADEHRRFLLALTRTIRKHYPGYRVKYREWRYNYQIKKSIEIKRPRKGRFGSRFLW